MTQGEKDDIATAIARLKREIELLVMDEDTYNAFVVDFSVVAMAAMAFIDTQPTMGEFQREVKR